MSSMTWRWIATLGWLLAGLPAVAQHWSFQIYGPDLGLTTPTILALHQDREGYLWISTEGGIFRYDVDTGRPLSGVAGETRCEAGPYLLDAQLAGRPVGGRVERRAVSVRRGSLRGGGGLRG